MLGDREFQGGKGYSTDAGTRVPFIAQWGDRAAGTVCDDLVDCTDFLPTMMQVARTALPGDVVCDGRSFLPQLMGDDGDPRDWIYQWHNPLPGHGKANYQLEEWAQTKEYKLYTDGRFYNVAEDDLETKEVEPETEEQDEAYAMLRSVLSHYWKQQ